ncbi:type II toxin-antitoxin system PemK/MazF family toxin [Aerococcaceae bacterium zg-ZJ1578]|uniref:type II toxin-antitoxin system PemK/MazF family toxin n=1 Tax=Aerococcaceae TaxID=186827 RepID=UPI0013BCB924|nr:MULTISPECIES: type II toxin-antitoxin system PemK/MazF family toxin [unclassified Facklamia]MBK0347542.1 type II toxin-antitoxin system PemK/MazF family toxin [Aerococcaceae bacterium zg-1578]MBS4461905.1 type II toxin-antitoxin system PemK/MazF family toxin [Aerococcaceae bacterium zg-B36]QQD66419.1 type II toxin-antitoxin system PemK/MazF family toxin [Aerococcaceae bacterium zg-252]NEW63561.1 type II toxin-antitoxin system PemK/MazF family toxin [Facklamia sp. 252]NEW67032.1 type II toxi
MVISQGDIFYVDFNPSMGHEQKHRRPAIALSHDLVAQFGGLTIVAPISTTERNYPTYHTLASTKVIKGKVMLDQTIALDLKARRVTKVEESLDKAELKDIIDKYKLLFDLV